MFVRFIGRKMPVDAAEKIYISCKMAASSAVLALAGWRFCHGASGLVPAALALCWAGDLALALAGEWHNAIRPRPFALGVVCFAAAQILLCACFMRIAGTGLPAAAVGAALAAGLTWALVRLGFLDFGVLEPLLVVYSALVGAMTACALACLPRWPAPALAGCAFAASDCGIALRSFSSWRQPLWGALILPLYYASILILAWQA
jgi:hypothetical protein